MAWTNSKIFSAYVQNIVTNITAIDLDTDALIKVALFDNTITPVQTATAALTAYAAATSAWVTGGVLDATGWPAVGRDLVTKTVSAETVATVTFDAADTVSANSTTTLTNAFGCLVYDDTIVTPVADQGVCYNYFGGANSVTSGTFTVVWNAAGIFALTL